MTVDTAPFCGACGYDYSREALPPVAICDACGHDLSINDPDIGPANPPSLASATPGVDQVTFTWTASPASFDCGYQFRYSIAGGEYFYINPATSPVVVGGVTGLEVCGELAGCNDGVWSDWSAPSCATGTA